METIEQDPNDVVLRQKPKKAANKSLIWQILTGVFALGMIIFAIIAFTGKSDDAKCKTESKATAKDGTSIVSSETTKDYTLKNFDVNIGKLVGAAGFSYGSILSIKTNADGSHMIGEIKNGNTVRYAIRALPDGNWTKGNLITGIETIEGANNTCLNIAKAELEVFKSYKNSSGSEAYCVVYNNIEEVDGSDVPEEQELKTAAEAIEAGLYKSES